MSEPTLTEKERAALLARIEVAVLRCEGEMGRFEMTHLGQEVLRLQRRGCRHVILDLAGVTHLDYRGLGGLADRARALRAGQGDLKVCGLSPYLKALFRVAGVEDEFRCYDSVPSAKAAFAEMATLAAVRR